jgi:hypothetical protein
MAATGAHLHLLAHVARMLVVLGENPEHARRAEYEEQIAKYKIEWAELPHDDKTDVEEQAAQLHDMDEAKVAAAVKTLES